VVTLFDAAHDVAADEATAITGLDRRKIAIIKLSVLISFLKRVEFTCSSDIAAGVGVVDAAAVVVVAAAAVVGAVGPAADR
jgi:hypothetical protein